MPLSPALIFDHFNGYQRTAALRAAVELDLFTRIARGNNTAAALAADAHTSERGIRILADAMVVLGMAEKSGDRYQLTEDGAAFLNRDSPMFIGDALNFLNAPIMVEAFDQLSQAVRQGGTALKGDPANAPDSEYWVAFARNMGKLQTGGAHGLAELLLPKPDGGMKVLDIAAGHGQFGIAMAQRNPQAQVYSLDWPRVLDVAKENAAAGGVADRMHWLEGSAFELDWGTGYDWVLMPNFLHHFDRATCVALLRRAKQALAPEGELAILEFVVDNDRVHPPQSALFAMIMLATTESGDAYSSNEYESMLHEAGFEETELHPLPPGFQRAIIAS
ncbi:MAG TPA: methyltransferase [Terriglobales bacterium]|nr:methyltransferase [Terriglobales bacterium]